LTDYAGGNNDAFDLIVSADTLVYFGELKGIVAAFVRALRPRGLLVFTLEHAVGNGDVDYRLQPHGRYSHGRGYVERLLTSAGLRPENVAGRVRMDGGRAADGVA